MQYITTRSDRVLYSVRDTLCADVAPDGGNFVPVNFPKFTREDIISLQRKSYGEVMADILNVFFDAELSGWDIDLTIGRNSARISPVGSKIFIGEMWHNPTGSMQSSTEGLYRCVIGNQVDMKPAQWFRIAVCIAHLFALYSELERSDICAGGTKIDISVSADDMIAPVAACYACEMGLPIGMTLISSSDSELWDLLHRGEINASGADISTVAGIERLVHYKIGFDAVDKFLSSIANRRTYFVDEERIPDLGKGMFCVVSGRNRYLQIMGSFAFTNRYILDPKSAQCVNALQDYRAKTGINNYTLILSSETPSRFIADITAATGLTEQSILEMI